MLALLVREPFAGVTPALYATLSDYQITEVYFAPRDDDLNLVPFYRRLDAAAAEEEAPAAEGFRSVEELGVPREALLMGVPMDFVLMFWQVWRDRGKEPAWIAEHFRDYVKQEHGGAVNGSGVPPP